MHATTTHPAPIEGAIIDLLAGGGSHWWTLEDIIHALEDHHPRREIGHAVRRLLDDALLARYGGRADAIYTLNALGIQTSCRLREERNQLALTNA